METGLIASAVILCSISTSLECLGENSSKLLLLFKQTDTREPLLCTVFLRFFSFWSFILSSAERKFWFPSAALLSPPQR